MAAAVLQLAWPRSGLGPDLAHAPARLPAAAQPRPLAPVILDPPPPVSQTLARPLFSPTRSGSGGGGGEAAATLGDYQFVGAIFAGARGSAIIKGPEGSRTLHAGEALLGWTVAEIRPQAMVLQREGQRLVIPVGAPLAPRAGAAQQ